MRQDELEDRLLNWGTCQRVYWTPGRCQSIEHMYVLHREKLTEGEMETRRTPRPVIDQRDAQEVECAWRKIKIRVHQQILKLHYVNRAPSGFICRHLGIQQTKDCRHFIRALRVATGEISSLLEKTLDSHNRAAIESRGSYNLNPLKA